MRFKLQDIDNTRFYQMPKSLFSYSYYKDLSIQAKVIYCLLRDRMELSRKNHWIDENGDIYLIFQQKDIAAALCISVPAVSREMQRLKEFSLIDTVSVGRGFAQKIYVNKIRVPDSTEDISSVEERLTSSYTREYSEEILTNAENMPLPKSEVRFPESEVRLPESEVRLPEMEVRFPESEHNDTNTNKTNFRETEQKETAASEDVSTKESEEEIHRQCVKSISAAAVDRFIEKQEIERLGLDRETLDTFAMQFGEGEIMKKLEILRTEMKNKEIRNPAGWLRRALECDYKRPYNFLNDKEARHQQELVRRMKERRKKKMIFEDQTDEDIRAMIQKVTEEAERQEASGTELALCFVRISRERIKRMKDELEERAKKQDKEGGEDRAWAR